MCRRREELVEAGDSSRKGAKDAKGSLSSQARVVHRLGLTTPWNGRLHNRKHDPFAPSLSLRLCVNPSRIATTRSAERERPPSSAKRRPSRRRFSLRLHRLLGTNGLKGFAQRAQGTQRKRDCTSALSAFSARNLPVCRRREGMECGTPLRLSLSKPAGNVQLLGDGAPQLALSIIP